jgi:hypothetical protein
MHPEIAPLPPQTASLLRSSLVIPSLPSALIELVQNSLDAHSTQVSLSIDLDRWTIKCEDNGRGITREDLKRVGGERYWTSKLDEGGMGKVETFGFRGEALASLADMALLEVLTRPSGGETFSLVVKGGARLFEGEATTKRPASGTTVWVRDIFYKVRRDSRGDRDREEPDPDLPRGSGPSGADLCQVPPLAFLSSPPFANPSRRSRCSTPSSPSPSPIPATRVLLQNVSSLSRDPAKAFSADGASFGVERGSRTYSSSTQSSRAQVSTFALQDSFRSPLRTPSRASSSVGSLTRVQPLILLIALHPLQSSTFVPSPCLHFTSSSTSASRNRLFLATPPRTSSHPSPFLHRNNSRRLGRKPLARAPRKCRSDIQSLCST